MIPNIGRPPRVSAIRVPNSGTPLMNDLVPSIGSNTQTILGAVAHAAELFADDAVIREVPLDQRAHGRFRRPVGGGHRAEIGLVLDRQRLSEIRPNCFPRRIGELQCKREIGVELGLRDQSCPSLES